MRSHLRRAIASSIYWRRSRMAASAAPRQRRRFSASPGAHPHPLPAIDDQPLPLVVASARAQPAVAWLTRAAAAPMQRSGAGFPNGGFS